MKLTDRRKKVFLAELARHGILVRAARAASPRASSQYGAVQTFKDERGRDEEFAAQWDEAMQAAEASVEHELYRRAQVGWDEPTRPCLRCRKPFESEGAHHRLCLPCTNKAGEVSPYAV